MSRNHQHHFLLVLLLVPFFFPVRAQKSAKSNILFILVDDLGWKDLGCYGSEFYDTPNLDLLATKGVRFTDAYAACPVCSPSRAAIMTGKHPLRVNITDWIPGMKAEDAINPLLIPPEDLDHLPLEEVTIGNHFNSTAT